MLMNCKTCHGQFECLQSSSAVNFISPIVKVHQKIRSFAVWHLENMGLWGLLHHAFLRTAKACACLCGKTPETQSTRRKKNINSILCGLRASVVKHWRHSELKALAENKKLSSDQDVLHLEPGELIEVKPVEEIMATLDKSRKCKGLLWMTGMRKFCGKRYRVLKKVERILLESNGELRKMRNTVLLDGVTCDGNEFSGCDRACFHFWREAWLTRVKE